MLTDSVSGEGMIPVRLHGEKVKEPFIRVLFPLMQASHL